MRHLKLSSFFFFSFFASEFAKLQVPSFDKHNGPAVKEKTKIGPFALLSSPLITQIQDLINRKACLNFDGVSVEKNDFVNNVLKTMWWMRKKKNGKVKHYWKQINDISNYLIEFLFSFPLSLWLVGAETGVDKLYKLSKIKIKRLLYPLGMWANVFFGKIIWWEVKICQLIVDCQALYTPNSPKLKSTFMSLTPQSIEIMRSIKYYFIFFKKKIIIILVENQIML